MRFNLFGFKGSLQTFEEDNKKEKQKSVKGQDPNAVVCTGYRPYVAFDERPVTPVPVRSNQASTSHAARNGAVPKTKATKEGIQKTVTDDKKSADKKKVPPKPVDKVKAPKPVDKSKEQKIKEEKPKEQKVKEQKVKEQKPVEKSKEQKTKDIKNKETKSADKKKEVKAKTTQNKDSKEQKVKTEKVKESRPKESKEKDKGTTFTQNSKSTAGKVASKKSKPPSTPVTDKTPLVQATHPAINMHLTKAKSTESMNGKQRNYHDDEDSETDTGGFLTVVSGKTKSAAPFLDNDDKSPLIFMTEDHGDGDDYEDISRFRGKSNKESNERENKAQSNYSTDYSNHAASIFFSGNEPEPTPRSRKFQHRDDDDNGSQTSA